MKKNERSHYVRVVGVMTNITALKKVFIHCNTGLIRPNKQNAGERCKRPNPDLKSKNKRRGARVAAASERSSSALDQMSDAERVVTRQRQRAKDALRNQLHKRRRRCRRTVYTEVHLGEKHSRLKQNILFTIDFACSSLLPPFQHTYIPLWWPKTAVRGLCVHIALRTRSRFG